MRQRNIPFRFPFALLSAGARTVLCESLLCVPTKFGAGVLTDLISQSPRPLPAKLLSVFYVSKQGRAFEIKF